MNSLCKWLLLVVAVLMALSLFGCGRERPIVVPETEQGE